MQTHQILVSVKLREFVDLLCGLVCGGDAPAPGCPLADSDAFVFGLIGWSGVALKKELQGWLFFFFY